MNPNAQNPEIIEAARAFSAAAAKWGRAADALTAVLSWSSPGMFLFGFLTGMLLMYLWSKRGK